MPLAVVVGLVEGVELHLGDVLGDDLHLDPGVLHEQFDEALGAEAVVGQEAVLLVGPELEADVHVVGPLVAGEPDEGLGVLEGHRHREVVDRAALDHAADVLVVVEPVVVAETGLEAGDHVGVVQVHVLDAAGEVLEDDEALLDVGHAADVEVPVEVELVEVSLDSVTDSHPVYAQDHVPPLPGHHDLVEEVVVQQGAQGHRGLLLEAEVDVEQQPVLDQLQGHVVALGAAAVKDDPVLVVGLEPQPEGVAKRGHRMPGEVTLDHRRSVKVENIGNVFATVELHSH